MVNEGRVGGGAREINLRRQLQAIDTGTGARHFETAAALDNKPIAKRFANRFTKGVERMGKVVLGPESGCARLSK